jgi:para-aminobenzoate synthetase component 1
MISNSLQKSITELPGGRNQLLRWASAHTLFCYLDGSGATDEDYAFSTLIAVGALRVFTVTDRSPLSALDSFLIPSEMGYVVQAGYGLKDHIEKLSSRHPDPIGFPALLIFEPAVLIRISSDGQLHIRTKDPEQVWKAICDQSVPAESAIPSITFRSRCSQEIYQQQLRYVLDHIQRGDCYELNYCQEFYAESVQIDPLSVFEKLSAVVQAPFSCLYRNGSRWLLGASPERFLRKKGDRLESRPMKGTAPRDTDPAIDQSLAEALQKSSKDRSENVMVVDLVRNDLSRVATRDSVQVDTLCELKSFPQVHQLVSTISAQIGAGVGFRSILEACFPMGSMTGAPKVRVMQLTDQYELSARGLYSGSIGFIEPNGDFDLNVVIRSLQYESDKGYLSYHVGSGVTVYSDPQREWEECRWKSAGIRRVFGG